MASRQATGAAIDLVAVEVGIAHLMELGDPSLVWGWSWRRFCAYWCRLMDEGARRRIEQEQRETKRRQAELLREARMGAGY